MVDAPKSLSIEEARGANWLVESGSNVARVPPVSPAWTGVAMLRVRPSGMVSGSTSSSGIMAVSSPVIPVSVSIFISLPPQPDSAAARVAATKGKRYRLLSGRIESSPSDVDFLLRWIVEARRGNAAASAAPETGHSAAAPGRRRRRRTANRSCMRQLACRSRHSRRGHPAGWERTSSGPRRRKNANCLLVPCTASIRAGPDP